MGGGFTHTSISTPVCASSSVCSVCVRVCVVGVRCAHASVGMCLFARATGCAWVRGRLSACIRALACARGVRVFGCMHLCVCTKTIQNRRGHPNGPPGGGRRASGTVRHSTPRRSRGWAGRPPPPCGSARSSAPRRGSRLATPPPPSHTHQQRTAPCLRKLSPGGPPRG